MFAISVALFVYVSGAEVAKLFMSSLTIFFSSKHLTPRAAQLQETLVALQGALEFRRDESGELRVGPMQEGARILLPDNALARDVQAVIEKGKEYDYAEYVAHAYYVECHELYDYSNGHFDFVSSAMPLFGLIGTIIGAAFTPAVIDRLTQPARDADIILQAIKPSEKLAAFFKVSLAGINFHTIIL